MPPRGERFFQITQYNGNCGSINMNINNTESGIHEIDTMITDTLDPRSTYIRLTVRTWDLNTYGEYSCVGEEDYVKGELSS